MFHVEHFRFHVEHNKRYTKLLIKFSVLYKRSVLIKCSVFYWPMLDFPIFKNLALAIPNYCMNVLNELSKMLCIAFFSPQPLAPVKLDVLKCVKTQNTNDLIDHDF